MWEQIIQIAEYIFLGAGILSVLSSIWIALAEANIEDAQLASVIGISLLLVAIAIKYILT